MTFGRKQQDATKEKRDRRKARKNRGRPSKAASGKSRETKTKGERAQATRAGSSGTVAKKTKTVNAGPPLKIGGKAPATKPVTVTPAEVVRNIRGGKKQ